jgi:hypothetical protein
MLIFRSLPEINLMILSHFFSFCEMLVKRVKHTEEVDLTEEFYLLAERLAPILFKSDDETELISDVAIKRISTSVIAFAMQHYAAVFEVHKILESYLLLEKERYNVRYKDKKNIWVICRHFY